MYNKSYNNNFYSMSDSSIVNEICNGIKQMRLSQNISQQELANRSGLNRVTISRMESGRAVSLLTLVQTLRALDKLDILNAFNEEPEVSPLKLFDIQEKYRRKASPKKTKK
ncbi:MAG: helix-turn-helix transcriptional regulator [Melioribacteraceae bacterium]|nr:helix-turn-helix transcriptional regulator [Melioribacteraceae bacterium]